MSSAPPRPVVLLHGFATSARRTWHDTGWVDLLRDAGRAVFALDLLGHGTAAKPTDPAAYERLEQDVLARFPNGEVDAIGFSLGARVLLWLASEHADRFGKLIVAGVGANLFAEDRQHDEMIRRAVEGNPDDANPVAHHFAMLSDDPEIDRAALSALIRRPHPPLDRDRLGRVTAPTLVVLGDQDFAGPADPLLEALPDARLKTLRGIDHFATPKDFGFIDAGLAFLGADDF